MKAYRKRNGGYASLLLAALAYEACVPPPQELRRSVSSEASADWFACRANEPRGVIDELRTNGAELHFVAAHRGITSIDAGNSRASIEAAVSAGVPLIEIDLRMNPEGSLFLFHDRKLAPGNAHVPADWFGVDIDSLNEVELKKIELPGRSRSRILFMPEAAKIIGESKTTAFLVDLKIPRADHPQALQKLLEIAKGAGAHDRIIVQCQGLDELRFTRKAHPNLPLLARLSAASEVGEALREHPLIVQGDPEWMSPDVVRKIHRSGKAVLSKVLGADYDTPGRWRERILAGANVLLTDKGESMKEWSCKASQ